MAVDGVIQVAPDSTGKNVDNTAIMRPDGTPGTTAYRQRVNISDPEDANVHMDITGEQGSAAARVSAKTTDELLVELIDEVKAVHLLLLHIFSN